MRRSAAGAALTLALPVALFASPAQASSSTTTELTVDAAAWSWRQTVPGVEPSNVPAGDLAVQYDGRPDAPPAKATYLRLALGDLPAGTTATDLQLTLPLDPAVSQDATGPLVACPLEGTIVVGDGVDPTSEPAEDCTTAVEGVWSATSVTFDLSGLASEWLAGEANNGVVIRPDPAAAVPDVLPFQLAFEGPSAVTALLTTSLLETTPVAPAPVVQPVAPGPALPPAPPALGTGTAIPVPAPMAVPAPPPVPPNVAPVAAAPVAAPLTTVVRAPQRASAGGLALAGALGVLLLALIGWCVGEGSGVGAFARAERRRLDRLRLPVLTPVVPPQVAWAPQIRQGRRPLASAASTVTYS